MAKALVMCRICMSVNIKMFTLNNTNMENVYKLLTGVYVDTEDGKPTTVCFLCFARLQQCDRLQQQAIKSNELLEQMLKGEFMQATASAILNGLYSSQDLQVSSTYYLELEPANCENVFVDTKVEANDLISVKEEEAIDEGCNVSANAMLYGQYSSQDLQVSSTYYLEMEPMNCGDDLVDPKVEANNLISVKEEGGINKRCDVTENHCLIQQEKEVKNYSHPSNAISIQQSDKTCYNNEEAKETITEEFKCNECGKQFSTKDILTDHSLKCMKTTENFVRGDQLTEVDTLKSLLSKIYSCDVCSFKTYDKRFIVTHLKMHNVTKVFSCNTCEYRGARKDDLKRHIRTHTGEKPFSCNICEYRCTLKAHLRDHMRTHTGEKPFSCNICEYRCAQKSVLKRHIRTHTGEKPFSCNICGCRCANKSGLKRHITTHTGEKPFSCNICEYRCARKCDLKIHTRTHTGEKPFSCSICEYRCAKKCDLKIHVRTHTGEKPFSCNICEYRCTQKFHLKTHMRTHTGEKPFSCNICEYRCVQKSYLKIHLRIHS